MTINPDTLINAAVARADSAAAAAQTVASQALSNIFIPGGTRYDASTPALRGTPPAYTGNMNIIPDIKQAFADAFGDFKPEMEEALADYIARFFPETIRAATDDWLVNTILYGGSGIPADIEDQIWQRARARDMAEGERLEDEALTLFASRGFAMPTGALYNQVMRVQQDLANKSSTASRDQAIKAAELEVENIKFAVQQGVQLRVGVIGALGNYIRAYMSPIEYSIDKAKLIADAQQRLWSSTADYYRAMIDEARLSLEAQSITSRSHDNLLNVQNSIMQRDVERMTNAALSVAKVLGDLAAGASNATVSLAATEASVISAS